MNSYATNDFEYYDIMTAWKSLDTSLKQKGNFMYTWSPYTHAEDVQKSVGKLHSCLEGSI